MALYESKDFFLHLCAITVLLFSCVGTVQPTPTTVFADETTTDLSNIKIKAKEIYDDIKPEQPNGQGSRNTGNYTPI